MMQKNSAYYLLLTISLIMVDQITKLIFSNRDFFVGVLHVHSVKNYGLAFSLNFGLIANIILISLGLIFFGVYYIQHHKQFTFLGQLAFIFIFAGAISNIIDRLYLGFVRDYLDLGLRFTFNLADALVVAGLILSILSNSGDKVEN